MNEHVIENRTSYRKQVAQPGFLSGMKLEFLGESARCRPSRVIRVEFVESGNQQVLVRRRSDSDLLHDSIRL